MDERDKLIRILAESIGELARAHSVRRVDHLLFNLLNRLTEIRQTIKEEAAEEPVQYTNHSERPDYYDHRGCGLRTRKQLFRNGHGR